MSGKSGYFLRLDSPEDLRQLRMSLGLPEPRATPSFFQLSMEWFESIVQGRVDPTAEWRLLSRLNTAVVDQAHGTLLGELNEDTLLPGIIQRAIAAMTDLGPATRNKVRSTGARVVDHARLDAKWRAGNPFEPVRRERVPRRHYDVLSLPEAKAVLRCIREDRRDLFHTAMIMGDRKGELLAWRKEDLDLISRTALIHRSNDRDQTKTGRDRQVPIPKSAVEPLRRAIQSSPSDFVFPRPNGSRFRADSNFSRILRTAMGDAGIVTGFDGKCRRKSCGYVERLDFRQSKACPRCSFQLWLVPRVRQIRFYDLRHTTATLHREAGCDPLVIKLLLGHAAADPTDDIYSHLSLEYQRRELDKLTL